MTRPRKPNDHHVFFPKKAFKERDEKHFRNQQGLIIPNVNVNVHNYLHRQIIPPPKPTEEEMEGISEFIEEARWYEHTSPYWGAELVMSYYVAVEIENPERAEEAREMRMNIARQIGILTVGHMPDTEEMKLFMVDGYVAS